MSFLGFLQDYFEKKTVDRGIAYFNEGKIRSFSLDSEIGYVEAQVQGTSKRPYRVEVDLSIEDGKLADFEADCTCPISVYCKHIAAVIYKLETAGYLPIILSQHRSNINKTFTQPFNDSAIMDKETVLVMDWLKDIEHTKSEDEKIKKDEALVVYVLNLQEGNIDGLTLTLGQVTYLKKGGFGKIKPLPSIWSDKKIPLSDAAILGKLNYACDSDGYSDLLSFELDNQAASTFLDEIIQTGRCFWNDLKSPPLSLGESRAIAYQWKTNKKLNQYFDLNVQPIASHVFFIAKDAWYVDLVHFQLGRSASAVNLDLILKLLNCPGFSPKQVDTVTQALKPLSTPLSIPLPTEFEKIETINVEPTPVFSVHLVEAGYPKKVYLLGELKFRYAKHLILWHEKQNEFYTKEKKSINCYPRNYNFENNALKLLEEKKLKLASSEDYFEKKWQECFFIEKLKSKTAEPVNLKLLLPALIAEKWQVINSPAFAEKLNEEELNWYLDVTDSNDWFDVEVGVSIGEKSINLIPVLEKWFQKFHDPLINYTDEQKIPIKINNEMILNISYKRIKLIANTLLELNIENKNNKAQLRLSRFQLSALSHLESKFEDRPLQWKGSEELKTLSQKLQHFSQINLVDMPKNLQASLRSYQIQGVSWLQFLREYTFSGILADDMGLGKTIQTIAHLLLEKNQGRMLKPCLIVSPTSLVNNWYQELQRFSPDLSILVLHGHDRKQRFDDIAKKNIILTTYPLLSRDAKELKSQRFYYVILDEAQAIKNPNTQAAKLLQEIYSDHRLCLTGTPMENHLGELWSLFHFLMPGFLGQVRKFNEFYRTPIEKQHNQERLKLLNSRVSPFLLRRKKEEVVKELPAITQIIHSIELEGEQRDLYESIRLSMHEKVKNYLNEKGLAKSQIIILDALLKLRQVCCDPRIVSLESALNVTASAKFELLFELLPELVEENRRILLFSSFTSMLTLIEERLIQLNIPYVKLTGSTKDRAKPINQFQSGAVPVFLISLKAGGTGLNLTAADVVIHYDPWWNPSAEEQATARAHRIGQDKPVFVYKLITKGTVEEKISHLQDKKRALVESLLAENNTKSLKLSLEDLSYLFDKI